MVEGATKEVRTFFDINLEGKEPLFTYSTSDGKIFHEVRCGFGIVLYTDVGGQPGEMIAEPLPESEPVQINEQPSIGDPIPTEAVVVTVAG